MFGSNAQGAHGPKSLFGAHARLDETPDYNTKKAKQLIEVSSEFAF